MYIQLQLACLICSWMRFMSLFLESGLTHMTCFHYQDTRKVCRFDTKKIGESCSVHSLLVLGILCLLTCDWRQIPLSISEWPRDHNDLNEWPMPPLLLMATSCFLDAWMGPSTTCWLQSLVQTSWYTWSKHSRWYSLKWWPREPWVPVWNHYIWEALLCR